MPGAETDSLEKILAIAGTLAPTERVRYVREACRSSNELYDAAISMLLTDSLQWYDLNADTLPVTRQPWQQSEGEIIGPYRVLRSLGRGGMGEVFLAERADKQFEQRVAIKLVKRDLLSKDIQARLRLERQILANLEHPNIARLLDGGTSSDGTPYIVMEYVDGKPIDTYCDELKLGVRQRLELFRSVCSAVHSAHQNLIVHRDLKPSNILVTAGGAPKLLDFGIAKLLDTRRLNQTLAVTHADVRMMTPDHASPEQLRGDLITTASDTYVLGVLLYELLTGFKPFVLKGNSLFDLERAICEEMPVPPGDIFASGNARTREELEQIALQRDSSINRLRRELQGDLGNIILMALRKEPERRYSSVQQFSDDIDRYLQGMPVRARTDTWTYRSSRFIKRHSLVATLSAVFIVALIGFTLFAVAQRNLAEAERQSAQSIALFLKGLFNTGDPAEARGKEFTDREMLEMGIRKIPELTGQPRQQVRILNTIGSVYVQRREFDKARPLLERSLRIQEQQQIRDMDSVDAMLDLANVHMASNELPKATELANQSLAISRRLAGAKSIGVARGECALGIIEFQRDRLGPAEISLRQCLATYESLEGIANTELTIPLDYMALIRERRGDIAQTVKIYRQLLEMNRGLGEDHPQYIRLTNNLAMALQGQNQLREAETYYRNALSATKRIYPQDSTQYAFILTNLGSLLQQRGDLAASDSAFSEALSVYERLKSPARDRAYVIGRIAGLALDRDELGKAETLYRRALDLFTASDAAGTGYEASVRTGLSKALLRMNQPSAAAQTIAPALSIWKEIGNAQYGLAQAILGRSHYQQGEREAAEPLLKAGYKDYVAKGDRESRDAMLMRSWLDEMGVVTASTAIVR